MTAIRLRGPGDVIASLPYQLGYHPRDSVVILALREGTVEMLERLDLPEAAEVVDAAAALVSPLLRERFDAVLLVGFESRQDLARPVLDALVGPLDDADITVLDRLVVRDGRWFSLDCTEGCCPADGLPLPDPAGTPAVADFVGQGVAPLRDRAAVAATISADPPLSDAVAVELRKDEGAPDRAFTTEAVGGGEAAGGGEAVRRLTWLALWAVVCRTDDRGPVQGLLSASEVAELVRSLHDIELRDALVAWLCPGSLPLAVLDPDLVDAVRSTLPPQPPRVRGTEAAAAARALLGRLEWLARAVPDPDAPPVLTLLANVAWHRGDGTLARVALDRALEHGPGYRLAQLVERLLDLGIRPGVEARPDLPSGFRPSGFRPSGSG
jgi:hypothetical protein